MIQVESTFSLQRFDTYEKLDEVVNRFIRTHKTIEVKPFEHKCDKCEQDVGYLIVYEE